MDKPDSPPSLTIAEVERDTGLGKDTLRAWERRYGFPAPGRNAHGERVYTQQDVDRLRSVRRLVAAGHRPGKLMAMAESGWRDLLTSPDPFGGAVEVTVDAATLEAALSALGRHDPAGLRRILLQAMTRMGMASFVVSLMAPLTTRIGWAWMRGELQVFEEHLYTEVAQAVLRQVLQAVPEPGTDAAPRVLLTTLPGEPHGLGLLMAEAMCALEGCACVSLGVQTPVGDIVRAAQSNRVDIVGISATACLPTRQIRVGLEDLRARLPDTVALWLGGSAAGLLSPPGRGRPAGQVLSFTDLRAIAPAVQTWRGRLVVQQVQ